MLPFRALNHYGRVMDFKQESYWYNIHPRLDNSEFIRMQLKLDPMENRATGVFDAISKGYAAVNLHRELDKKNEEAYLTSMEDNVGRDFSISSYELVKERTDPQKVSQRVKFEIDNLFNGTMAYLDPFLIKFFTQNPFQLRERNYPIDFGYPRSYKYQVSIPIPDGYVLDEFPKNQAMAVPGNTAILRFAIQNANNQLFLSFHLDIKDSYFEKEAYDSLKSLFSEVVNIQKNSLVVLRKKTVEP
ncbi:MAG: hypothetical protein AAFX53_07510 [Bacteroidota bacterium]